MINIEDTNFIHRNKDFFILLVVCIIFENNLFVGLLNDAFLQLCDNAMMQTCEILSQIRIVHRQRLFKNKKKWWFRSMFIGIFFISFLLYNIDFIKKDVWWWQSRHSSNGLGAYNTHGHRWSMNIEHFKMENMDILCMSKKVKFEI